MTHPDSTTPASPETLLLHEVWSYPDDDPTKLEDLITDLCGRWDHKARGVGCVGLLLNSAEPPTNLDVGAGFVGSLLTKELQKLHAQNDESAYQRAGRRVELTCKRLDPRFLWCLLDWIVKQGTTASHSHITLVQAICQIAPDLPFLSANSWPVQQDVSSLGREKSPLVKCVTREGLTNILEALLGHSETIRKLQSFYEIQNEDTTIFFKAIELRDSRAVEVLLRMCPEICRQILEAGESQTMFLLAGSRVRDLALETIASMVACTFPDLLDSGELLATALGHPNAELAKIYYSFKAVSGGEESYKIIRDLIECRTLQDDELLALDRFKEACLLSSGRNTLLHLAIKSRRLNLVDFLSTRTQGVLTRDGLEHGERYALWYNNHDEKWTRDQPDPNSKDAQRDRMMRCKKEAIRKSLVAAIIRKCDPVQIDEIIDASDDKIREYTFDITGFNKQDLSLRDFVAAFMNVEQQKSKLYRKLKFEELLKYVQLPKIASTLGDAAHEHEEVKEVMAWLWKKGVRIVLRLTVPDRLWGPHNEKCIAEIASSFQVETLDWRCQDLSFTCLEELYETKDRKQRRATEHLKVIHLYSSGKSAVHRYWLGPKGLENKDVFPRLEHAILHVIKDNLPAQLIDSAYDELCRLRAESRKQHPNSEVRIEIKKYSWQSQQKYIRGDSIQEITSRAFPPRLCGFLKLYHDLQFTAGRTQRTRVAIIDNGVIAMNRNTDLDMEFDGQSTQRPFVSDNRALKDISDQVVIGKSFVHNVGQRKSSWFIATDPHGSQMAALICALDPHAEILVAKVADHHADVYPDRVAKAIDWARTNKADIISMSFVCGQQSGSLDEAIKRAAKKNIVMFASHHDEGLNRAHAYPADYAGTITIAASTPQGDPIYNTKEEKYQYLFPGLNVFVGRVAQLASPETITGSSVATATAAGMASLIMSCLRFCNRGFVRHSMLDSQGMTADGQLDDTSSDDDGVDDDDESKIHHHHHDTNQRANHEDGHGDPPHSLDEKQCLKLPLKDDTDSTWRVDTVKHFFNKMGAGKYVALSHIGGLDETIVDLETVDFESSVVRKWFCREFAVCARGKDWEVKN